MASCADCWDNPCTCSDAARQRRAAEDATKAKAERDALAAMSPGERIAHWKRSIPVELAYDDAAATRAVGLLFRSLVRKQDDEIAAILLGKTKP